MKVLIHDGLGIWLCARRLYRGKFCWGEVWRGERLHLTDEQLSALIQGLPWQRLGSAGVISVVEPQHGQKSQHQLRESRRGLALGIPTAMTQRTDLNQFPAHQRPALATELLDRLVTK